MNSSNNIINNNNNSGLVRQRLDQLFVVDSISSVAFGVIALGAPHGLLVGIFHQYNHSVHETLRLYGCLRLACGWILWHVRKVDDGIFRRHVCEALGCCYILQALAVLRAQWTDVDDGNDHEQHSTLVNWVAVLLLLALSGAYGSFRFGKGGNLIKVYQLPTAASMLHDAV